MSWIRSELTDIPDLQKGGYCIYVVLLVVKLERRLILLNIVLELKVTVWVIAVHQEVFLTA
jgi:hypothetical protein